MLWGCNPFIERCDCNGAHERFCPCRLTPSAGYVKQGRFYDIVNTLPLGSTMEAMERAHGLPGPYSLAPKIYYKAKPSVLKLSKVVLLDMHALSSSIHPEGWAAFHQKMTDRFGPISLVKFADHIVRSIPQPPGVPTYGVGSIFEYVDMLACCRAFVGSEAGGQALAAAVRGEHDVFDRSARPEIVCLMAPNTYNSRAFCFRGVDYRVSKFAAGGDYLEPVEVAYSRYSEACSMSVKAKRAEYFEATK